MRLLPPKDTGNWAEDLGGMVQWMLWVGVVSICVIPVLILIIIVLLVV